jgi:hypothetical protein
MHQINTISMKPPPTWDSNPRPLIYDSYDFLIFPMTYTNQLINAAIATIILKKGIQIQTSTSSKLF